MWQTDVTKEMLEQFDTEYTKAITDQYRAESVLATARYGYARRKLGRLNVGDTVMVRFSDGAEKQIYEGIKPWPGYGPISPKIMLRGFTKKGPPYKNYSEYPWTMCRFIEETAQTVPGV